MKYNNLKTNELYEEKDNKSLSFLYNTFIGRVLLKILTTKFVANIVRVYQNSFLSKHKIKSFIKENHINIYEYEENNYKSFNDFFMRTIKKDNRPLDNGLIAPCDSKVSVYKID